MENGLDINEVLKTVPPEMVEDMKAQAEKYGFSFEEYVQSVLGAIVMDPDMGAYADQAIYEAEKEVEEGVEPISMDSAMERLNAFKAVD